MGTQDERDPRLGGGSDPQGADLQLTFLPNAEEQQNTIEAEAAAKAAEKASAFSISQEEQNSFIMQLLERQCESNFTDLAGDFNAVDFLLSIEDKICDALHLD